VARSRPTAQPGEARRKDIAGRRPAARVVGPTALALSLIWYMVANNEGHGFRKKGNRDTFWQLSVMFFEKHLKVR
jgi:hypothetical protein